MKHFWHLTKQHCPEGKSDPCLRDGPAFAQKVISLGILGNVLIGVQHVKGALLESTTGGDGGDGGGGDEHSDH